ncbi:MAG: DUF3754 domain-containing protein [Dichotomicrobium sp.]
MSQSAAPSHAFAESEPPEAVPAATAETPGEAAIEPDNVIEIAGVRDIDGDEKFIPVSQFALVESLAAPHRWPDHDAAQVRLLFDYMTRWRNLYYSDKLDRLTENYLPFDPDADITGVDDLPDEHLAEHQARLFEELRKLIEGANYDEITREEVDQILTANSPYGVAVHVELSEFEDLMLYARGATCEERWERDWRWLFLRHRCYRVPIFQRLFLALKFKSEEARAQDIMRREGISEKKARKRVTKERANLPPHLCPHSIHIKVFKRIPQIDLEMLFPNTQVRLKYIDKVKLWITGGSGGIIGLVTGVPKILASTATVATNPIGLIMALGGLGAVFVRQVMNFFNTRNKYMMQLAQNLYFQSLSNNRGALTLLIDRAEEEDIKEDILLYSLLLKERVYRSEIDDAKQAIEQFLKHEFGVSVGFDIMDALDRLSRDGLVREMPDGELRALPLADALDYLRGRWSEALDRDLTRQGVAA